MLKCVPKRVRRVPTYAFGMDTILSQVMYKIDWQVSQLGQVNTPLHIVHTHLFVERVLYLLHLYVFDSFKRIDNKWWADCLVDIIRL